MKKLAIVSPKQAEATETFIRAHRGIPGAEIKFYYDGIQQAKLEGQGMLLDLRLSSRVKKKLHNPLGKFGFSPAQEAVAKSFMKEEIDCILAEYGHTGVLIMPIAKALKIPLYVHFHGFDASMHSVIEELGESYREMFEVASGIFAVSERMREMLIDLGCPSGKVHLNTYGANPKFLEIRPSYSEKLLVGLGRFVDKKAPYYTILAFREVLEKHPDARLVIGGNGDLYDTCTNLVKYFKLEDKIALPGLLEPREYMDLLSKCRAFVQHSIRPSNGDMEGTPLAVLEAQAAGVPVIASKHAGIPDVVLHEKTGLLFEEHDVATMAAQMSKLLEDPETCALYGQAGRQRIIEKFSMERHLHVLSETMFNSL
jgi:glycosyltransferase involved in cell wall biosynthesis